MQEDSEAGYQIKLQMIEKAKEKHKEMQVMQPMWVDSASKVSKAKEGFLQKKETYDMWHLEAVLKVFTLLSLQANHYVFMTFRGLHDPLRD